MLDRPGSFHEAASPEEAAWLAAPSLAHLTRWLLADDAPVATVRARAAESLELRTALGAGLVGLLHLVAGAPEEAARLLAGAPALGWYDEGHAGPVLFPALVWMVCGRPEILSLLGHPPGLAPTESRRDPVRSRSRWHRGSLRAPSVLEVLERGAAREHIITGDVGVMIAALREAAAAHVETVIHLRQRRDYGRAATLIVACADIGRDDHERSAWVAEMERRTASFPAFRTALRGAFTRGRGRDDFTAAG